MKLNTNNRKIELTGTQIMGILNVTPDSFFDGGHYNTLPKSIDHVNKMIKYGATLIDIGGESTRPGSIKIDDQEELERVLPVIKAISNRFDVLISINTSSALVIQESSKVGVHLINDVRSLNSQDSIKAVKKSGLAICLVHMQGVPRIMQDNPIYFNVVHEVSNFFDKQIKRCESFGIDKSKILLDPGFGFGKKTIHNYQLLSNLKYFHRFQLPLLIGVSRKSMFTYSNNPANRLIGSITGVVIAAMQGVHIVRVHDVQETMEALQVIKMMNNFKKI